MSLICGPVDYWNGQSVWLLPPKTYNLKEKYFSDFICVNVLNHDIGHCPEMCIFKTKRGPGFGQRGARLGKEGPRTSKEEPLTGKEGPRKWAKKGPEQV